MFVEVQVDLISWFEEVPFQGSSAHIDDINLSCPSLYATFILYHIFSSLSRGFEKVFKFFRRPSRSSRFRSWRDFYIISYLKPFVKWFFKISWNSFLKLFLNSAGSLDCFALSLTALILYHIPRRMSTPFSTFFLIHHICFIFLSFMTFECTNATDSDNSRKISQKLFILKCFSAIIYFWKESLWTTHLL